MISTIFHDRHGAEVTLNLRYEESIDIIEAELDAMAARICNGDVHLLARLRGEIGHTMALAARRAARQQFDEHLEFVKGK